MKIPYLYHSLYKFGAHLPMRCRSILSLPHAQKCLGILLGVGCYFFAETTVPALSLHWGIPVARKIRFLRGHFLTKMILIPICPMSTAIWEEDLFRGNLRIRCKGFFRYYTSDSLDPTQAHRFATISSLFEVSILYGVYLQILPLLIGMPPIQLLPQFCVAIFFGVLLGASAEYTDHLYLSSGMNVGYKVVAWLS